MVDDATLIHPTPTSAHPPHPRKGQKRKDQRSKIPGDTKAEVVDRKIGEVPETVSRAQD